jgi:hypothetical protein
MARADEFAAADDQNGTHQIANAVVQLANKTLPGALTGVPVLSEQRSRAVLMPAPPLPTRAWLSRLLLLATASTRALFSVLGLLLTR